MPKPRIRKGRLVGWSYYCPEHKVWRTTTSLPLALRVADEHWAHVHDAPLSPAEQAEWNRAMDILSGKVVVEQVNHPDMAAPFYSHPYEERPLFNLCWECGGPRDWMLDGKRVHPLPEEAHGAS